jgi:hypothetical protein
LRTAAALLVLALAGAYYMQQQRATAEEPRPIEVDAARA